MSAPEGLTREYTYCWSIWRGWVYCKTEERWDAGVEAYWEEKQNDPEFQQLLKRYEETNTFFKFFIRLFNIGNLGKIVSAKDYYQKLAQEEEYMQQPSPHFFQWLWQGFLNGLSSIARLFHFSSRGALQVQSGQEDEEPFVHEHLKGSRDFSTESHQKDYFKIFEKDLKGADFEGLLDGIETLGLIEEKEAEEFRKNGYVELSRTIYRARFLELARANHPDRHVKKSEAEIQQASNQFVKIQEAYQKIEEVFKNWQGREKSKEVFEFSEDVSSQVKKYAELWNMFGEYAENVTKYGENVTKYGENVTKYGENVKKYGEGIRELREGYDEIGDLLERLKTQIEFLEECKKQEAMMAAPHDEKDGRESIQGSEESGDFYTNGFADDRQLFSDEEVFADDEKDFGDVGSPVSPKDQNVFNQNVGVTAVSREENSVGSGHVGVYRELSQSREDGSRSGSSSPKAADRPKDGHRRTFSL